jgi:pimeloyl-ACP methyl ester carboxylesterase
MADGDEQPVIAQKAGDRLAPGLRARLMQQLPSASDELLCSCRDVGHLELDAGLWPREIGRPARCAEARAGCLRERPQAEVLDAVELLRERVVLLAAFEVDAELLAVEAAGARDVLDDRRGTRDELDPRGRPWEPIIWSGCREVHGCRTGSSARRPGVRCCSCMARRAHGWRPTGDWARWPRRSGFGSSPQTGPATAEPRSSGTTFAAMPSTWWGCWMFSRSARSASLACPALAPTPAPAPRTWATGWPVRPWSPVPRPRISLLSVPRGSRGTGSCTSLPSGHRRCCGRIWPRWRGASAATPKRVPELFNDLPAADEAVLERAEVRQTLAATMTEAFRQGARCAVHDIGLEARPWDVDLAAIQTPVEVWHGHEDTLVPLAQGKALARASPTATARLLPEEGHISLRVNHIAAILDSPTPLEAAARSRPSRRDRSSP